MGVLLYFLVSGRYPVSGADIKEIRERHHSHDVRMLREERPDLPDAYVQWVERALAPKPSDRYSTAGQLEAALAASVGIDSLVILASPEPLAEFEAELARLALPAPDSIAVPMPPETRVRLRGIGGLTEAAPAHPSGDTAGLFEMARRLSGQAETVEGVWMREIELDNPGSSPDGRDR